jgi:hypothetical protein
LIWLFAPPFCLNNPHIVSLRFGFSDPGAATERGTANLDQNTGFWTKLIATEASCSLRAVSLNNIFRTSREECH